MPARSTLTPCRRPAVHRQAVHDARDRRSARAPCWPSRRSRRRRAVRPDPEWCSNHSLLASATGVLLALSFPKFGHPACAWVALVPLLLALRGLGPLGRPRPIAAPGAPSCWAGGPASSTSPARCIGPAACWHSSAACRCRWRRSRCCSWPATWRSIPRQPRPRPRRACRRSAIGRWRWCRRPGRPPSSCAARFFGGFPWVPLGNSQVEVLPIAQMASVVGVYGLSAFVAAVNVAVAVAFLSSGRTRCDHRSAPRVASIADRGCLGRVAHRASAICSTGAPPLRVGLVQANIAQGDKWDPRQARRILTTYMAMSRDVVKRGAQYVIWPESSTPGDVRGGRGGQRGRARPWRPSCACRCSSAATSSSGAATRAITTPRSWSGPTAARRPCTARSSWCRSASSFRFRSGCRLCRRWSSGRRRLPPGRRW